MKTLTQQSIKQLNVNKLTPHPDNPRIHSKAQIKQVAKIIESFGFKIPILIDGNHQIIAGHGRVEAAQLLDIAIVADFNQLRSAYLVNRHLSNLNNYVILHRLAHVALALGVR